MAGIYFDQKCIQPRMRGRPKPLIPKFLPVSPLSLVCPHCGANPGKDCISDSGAFSVVHIARIQAAAAQDIRDNPPNPVG